MKRLLLALAATVFLSCQNDQATATVAPPSGGLALRIVSTKALAEVESVSVKLSWGDGQSKETTVPWSRKNLRLDGLPLDARITVHMEGWNDERGRPVVYWSGDTALTLASSATSWNMTEDAPILIRDAEVPAAPDLARVLASGASVVDGKLSLTLPSGKLDTVRIDTTGVDTVYADSNEVAKIGREFLIVVGGTCDSSIVVVGKSGLVSTFKIVSGRLLKPASELVKMASGDGSWNKGKDTLAIFLDKGEKDTIRIDPTGVASVLKGKDPMGITGDAYVIEVDAPGAFHVTVKGDGDRMEAFQVVVTSAAEVVARRGLVAHPSNSGGWVGATCSLRVVIDSGKVSGVSLVRPSKESFTQINDTLWGLERSSPKMGSSDSLEIHVYGTGSDDKADSVLIGVRVNYDRKGPDIEVSDTSPVVGANGGTVSWYAKDERGVQTIGVKDGAGLTVSCSPNGDTCVAQGVKRSFTVRAVDRLGNESTREVKVRIDSDAPTVTSVRNASDTSLLRPDDTLWTFEKVGLQVNAYDTGSTFKVVATRAKPSQVIVKEWNPGAISVAGLGEGTWTLSVQDAVGNVNDWGTIVVRTIAQTGDLVPGFGASFRTLPQWISKSCSLVVARDSGWITGIDSKLDFKANSDSTRWVAYWELPADSATDSVSLEVSGRGTRGNSTIRMGARVRVDRDGPVIEVKSRLRDGKFHMGKDGGSLVFTVSDERGVRGAWIGDAKASCDRSGICNATVTESVKIRAMDSLGNEREIEVAVMSDTVAPEISSVRSGNGTDVSPGTILRRTSDSGYATLRVVAADAGGNGVVVRLESPDGTSDATVAAVNGAAVIKDASPGEWTVNVYDSLGNKTSWGTLLVHDSVRTPVISRDDGVFGAESLLRGATFDSLPVTVACPDSAQGARLLLKNGNLWLKLDGPRVSHYWGGSAIQFRCLRTGDSSLVVGRTWVMLQRPWIEGPVNIPLGAYVSAIIHRDSTRQVDGNPDASILEYCFGDSATCASKTQWSGQSQDDSLKIMINRPGTLWTRVSYKGKTSFWARKDYVNNLDGYAWVRTFPVDRENADEIWAHDRVDVKSVLAIDTVAANVTDGVLTVTGKWRKVGRGPGQYGGILVDVYLDSGKYFDLTDLTSLAFGYSNTSALSSNGIKVYPLWKGSGENTWSNAPSFMLEKTFGFENLAASEQSFPTSTAGVAWDDVRGSIYGFRFAIDPQSVNGVPTESSTSFSLQFVDIMTSKGTLPISIYPFP